MLLRTNFFTLDTCESNNINAFTRAFLVAIFLGTLLSAAFDSSAGYVLIFLILGLLYSKWLMARIIVDSKTAIREAFQPAVGANIRPDMKTYQAFPEPPMPAGPAAPSLVTRPGVAVSTQPTARNPFMNVLLDEISYNPTRPAADDITNPANKVALDDYFRVNWFNDPTDVFGKTQGQRQFYTMPSSSIPNDQGSYQNWLYLIPGKTCKEGGRDACVPGTNGGAIPWLSQPN